MTNKQEILDFLNKANYPENLYFLGFDIHSETNYNVFIKYVKATQILPNKRYYKIANDGWPIEFGSDPVDLSLAYEEVVTSYPKSATIDTNTYTYYTSNNTGVLTEEINPTSEDVLDYLIIIDENASHTNEYVATLDDVIFANVLQNYIPVTATRTPNNTMYYIFTDYNYINHYTYDENGNLISSLNDTLPLALNEHIFLARSITNNFNSIITDKDKKLYDFNSKSITPLGHTNEKAYLQDGDRFYEITHIPTPQIINVDTSDNIIIYFVMLIMSAFVLLAPMLKKENINK